MYQGSCLCGAVRLEIVGELAPIQVCHCSQCRKAQGAPFATNIPVTDQAFRLLSGAELLEAFESSPGKRRVFCGRCGSPIYGQNERAPGVRRIRAGSLDGLLNTKPEAHFHVACKANWWALEDELPKFAAAYSGPVRSAVDED